MDKSKIVEFFNGKSIFLTGVTGFLGEAVAEKILRSCPGVQNVFALVRSKKEPDPRLRLKNQVQFSPVFQKIREKGKDSEQILSKLVPIAGDMSLPNLGISSNDRELLCSQVSVVIHSGANVKFYDKIKKNVKVNLQGTKSILELAKEMTKLESLVHVSSAYCHFNRLDRKEVVNVDEIVYPTEFDPNQIIEMLRIMPDDVAEMVTPKLIDGDPHSYMLTKRLGEKLVLDYYREFNLPAAIVRPSCIGPAYADWTPGLARTAQMCSRYFLGIGLGHIRSMKGDSSLPLDLIPMDHVVNQTLAVAWATAQSKTPESKHSINRGNDRRNKMIPLYNCCIGQDNPVTWGEGFKYLDAGLKKYPLKNTSWYPFPNSVFTRSSIYHQFRLVMFNFLPVVVKDTCVDLKRALFGPKSSKKRVGHVEKFVKFSMDLDAILLLTVLTRTFSKKNTWALFHKMNKTDQELFNFDVREINWAQFMESHVVGLKKYVLKEDLEDPKSKIRLKILWAVHRGVQFLAISLILLFGWNLFQHLQQSFAERDSDSDSTTNANQEDEEEGEQIKIEKNSSNQSADQVEVEAKVPAS